MPPLTDHAFTFASQALPVNPFTVVRFSGEEKLSSLYRFEILLVAKMEDAIDLTAVLQNPATFTIKKQMATGSDLPFHGILSAFEELHQAGDYVFYRAELRPRLWWVTLTNHNQVFLNQKVDQFLATVLQDGGLSQGLDFEFRFQGKYLPWEYLCQYAESHFDFISRWLEREGACYWFEQSEHGEKMIVSDTLIAHTALPGHETFLYSPPSGLDAGDADKVIKRFTLRQSPLPKNVLLKDYNYMKPNLDLQGKAPVQGQGRGEIYLYGEHFLDQDEADRLAKVRAEEFLCREKIFHGLSAIPGVRPGYLFTLKKHFREEFNQQYLTMAVRHEGSQERYLSSGLGVRDLEDQDGLFYRNTFECLPATAQFRPARVTPKPRITGTLSAKIDAAGSGQYAELDEHGRYKVILPFDLAGRQAGKSSAPLRMMQPYAGPGQGMHFPLRKGVEVLLTFLDGDPDRPVIAGALPNPECQSPVNADNQSMATITTGGGNKIHMEDKEGSQRILLHCDYAPHESYIRIGAHNDPEDEGHSYWGEGAKDYVQNKYDEASSDNGLKLFSVGDMDVRVRNKSETILGKKTLSVYGFNSSTVIGSNSSTVVGADSRAVVGPRTQAFVGGLTEYDTWQAALIPGWATIFGKKKVIGASEDKLKGQVTDLYTHHMKLLGKVEKLQGQVSEFEGEKSVMTGTIEKLQGKVTAVEGENSTLRGQVSELSGTVTKIEGESSKMSGRVQSIEGSVTNLRGDVTNVEGNLIRLSTSVAQVAANISII
ncbi:MAG: type VI secretion system tip protein TssI/VgrG [Pseudomonadota bacterium]